MQPVWVLSVDLQTKTATFQSGLSDAARSARGAFGEIRGGAGEMGREVGRTSGEARHAVMLLTEEFGGHMPRAIATFIASLGPLGAALEAAFPFLAIIVGATLLLEHLVKMHEAGEKLTEDQGKFATAVQNAFNSLDEKLLQAQIKSDELRNDHLGALKKQLELIDMQSMSELAHQFDELAKSAETVFADLKVSWYQFGIGSEGAKHALTEFQLQYENLLSHGKTEEASGLLSGTLKQAQRVLDMQNQAKANDGTLFTTAGPNADISLAIQAENELKKQGVGFTQKEIESQEALVQTLSAAVGLEEKRAALTSQQKDNATKQDANAESAKNAAEAKQAADSMLRLGEQAVAADRATANAQLDIHRATIEQRLASDIDFAARERDVQLAGNDAQIAALDKSGKDYQNQLKAAQEKALEITGQFATQEAELRARASVAANLRDVQMFEQGEKEKIEATRQGSAARIAALSEAIEATEARQLQDTQFYRELLTQRVQATRQEAEEEAKLREEAGKQSAESELKSGELILAAHRQAVALMESLENVSRAKRISDLTQDANLEFQLKQAALDKEIAALDKNGKDYQNKLKQLQDQELQLVQQHEQQITDIKDKAQQQQNQQTISAMTQLEQETASGLAQVIMGHESFAKMLDGIGNQVVSGMLRTALMSMMTADMDKEKQAAKAARTMFNAGTQFPFPVNIVMAPLLGASAFAAVMAFAGGTDSVPGVGRGDTVPAMLTPGEGVVPGGVMDGLRNVAKNGGFERGPRNHVTMHVQLHGSALDSDGMDAVLEKHADKLNKHVGRTLRRLNR
jgi:hypothetical protein